MSASKPRIAILTFCVGADYKKAMEPGIASKRAYAAKHGYDFLCGGEDVWDRDRPIPWSKFNFIRKYLDEYDYLFWSDADVIILNQDLPLETQVLPLLPQGKDLLWTYDACAHYNNGHLLIRGRSAWARDYFNRCYEQTDVLFHIWWDNAAMIKLFETQVSDKNKMETCTSHWLFNSYVFGPKDSADDPSTRLYKRGDFLIHFAGVYDPWNIYRMMLYAQRCAEKRIDMDTCILDMWRKSPPANKAAADASLLAV
jgi:lipopolysaccharide biosynthesis glycosyltransferase